MMFVGVLVTGVFAAAALVFLAIGENMLYFFSPTQVMAGEAPRDKMVRVGGLVVAGSVNRGEGLAIRFDLTDNSEQISVVYEGILPDLFREGQGIVAMGKLDGGGVFRAQEVLAKHDENYMPPEVAEALKLAEEGGRMPESHTKGRP
jgi:cytochrome c-type biogenesis protein CcmE